MNTKNLLITCDDLSVLGGSVITTIRFANALCDLGWNIVFVTCNSNAVDELDPRIKIEFATWFFFVPGGKNWGKVGGFSTLILKRIMKKYEISVVLSSHVTMLGWGSLYVANQLNIPNFSLCSGQVENATEGFPSFFRVGLTALLESVMRIYYSQARHILPQSRFSAELLKRYTQNENVTIISNGVDTKQFKKLPKDVVEYIADKFHLNVNDFNIAFLGRMSKEKCVEDLINAFSEFVKIRTNARLVLIGNGPYKDELINLVRELKLVGKVSFLGYISKADVIGVLNVCDVYAHPSEIELEGMSLLEAMACGKPIVVSDSPLSASSQFVENNGFTYNHHNIIDLRDKLLKMYDSKIEGSLEILSQKSLNIAQKYSFNESVAKLNDLLITNHEGISE